MKHNRSGAAESLSTVVMLAGRARWARTCYIHICSHHGHGTLMQVTSLTCCNDENSRSHKGAAAIARCTAQGLLAYISTAGVLYCSFCTRCWSKWSAYWSNSPATRLAGHAVVLLSLVRQASQKAADVLCESSFRCSLTTGDSRGRRSQAEKTVVLGATDRDSKGATVRQLTYQALRPVNIFKHRKAATCTSLQSHYTTLSKPTSLPYLYSSAAA